MEENELGRGHPEDVAREKAVRGKAYPKVSHNNAPFKESRAEEFAKKRREEVARLRKSATLENSFDLHVENLAPTSRMRPFFRRVALWLRSGYEKSSACVVRIGRAARRANSAFNSTGNAGYNLLHEGGKWIFHIVKDGRGRQ